jgi:flagellar basal body-associated protein FliL
MPSYRWKYRSREVIVAVILTIAAVAMIIVTFSASSTEQAAPAARIATGTAG